MSKKFNNNLKNGNIIKFHDFKKASIKFKAITSDIDFNGKTILDISCGIGDILPFVSSKADSFEYLGLDKSHTMIEEAYKRYPNLVFKNIDYFTNPLNDNFDIILCYSGLSYKFGNGDSFRKSRIKYMYEHTNYCLAFEIRGGSPQPENKRGSSLYYSDALEILKFCTTLTSRVVMKQNYAKNFFLIFMFKKS